MKRIYRSTRIILLAFAFLATPVLGREAAPIPSKAAASQERLTGSVVSLEVPKSFFSARTSRHETLAAGKTAKPASQGITPARVLPDKRPSTKTESLTVPVPLRSSLSPESVKKVATARKGGKTALWSRSQSQHQGHERVGTTADTREAPRSFFPQRACRSKAC